MRAIVLMSTVLVAIGCGGSSKRNTGADAGPDASAGTGGMGGEAGTGGAPIDAGPDVADAGPDVMDAAPDVDAAPPDPTATIYTGNNHTCLLRLSGDVICWGSAMFGQLGYGTLEDIGDDELPSSIGPVDVGANPTQLSAGGGMTCALLDDQTVKCWGFGMGGQIGRATPETIGDDELPSSVGSIDLGGPVAQISGNGDHTCALRVDGEVICWGAGTLGRLGYGNTENIGDDETPASAGPVAIGASVRSIHAGGEHTCALLDGGAVTCWGNGQFGLLGRGDTITIGDDETPDSVGTLDLGGNATRLSVGRAHSCALLETGDVICWGRNQSGQLGHGDTENIGDDETPASIGPIDVGAGTIVRVVAGNQVTCVLFDDGTVKCWGLGFNGALGYGNPDAIGDDELPSSVGFVDVGSTVVDLALGGSQTCVVTDTGAARCWGFGGLGRLGYGNTENVGDDETPAMVGDVPAF